MNHFSGHTLATPHVRSIFDPFSQLPAASSKTNDKKKLCGYAAAELVVK